jgi:hypothetical protein
MCVNGTLAGPKDTVFQSVSLFLLISRHVPQKLGILGILLVDNTVALTVLNFLPVQVARMLMHAVGMLLQVFVLTQDLLELHLFVLVQITLNVLIVNVEDVFFVQVDTFS